MSYVKFNGNPEIFKTEIVSSRNLVRIFPPFPEESLTSGFKVLTKPEMGRICGNYHDFKTVYRTLEDGSVILSNDGSIWAPPPKPVHHVTFTTDGNAKLQGLTDQEARRFEELEIPEVLPELNYKFVCWFPEIPRIGEITENKVFTAIMEYVPSLEELKIKKKEEIGTECNRIVSKGIDVTFPDGHSEHFSLEENLQKHDQINLFGKQYQLAAGAERVEYHEDGKPCKWYTAEEMQQIIHAAMSHVSYHTTYCNSLNVWINEAETKEELGSIFYGADIPEEYQSEVLKDYIVKIMGEEG